MKFRYYHPHSPRKGSNELIRLAARRPRTLSCGTFSLAWKQNYDKETIKIKVSVLNCLHLFNFDTFSNIFRF